MSSVALAGQLAKFECHWGQRPYWGSSAVQRSSAVAVALRRAIFGPDWKTTAAAQHRCSGRRIAQCRLYFCRAV